MPIYEFNASLIDYPSRPDTTEPDDLKTGPFRDLNDEKNGADHRLLLRNSGRMILAVSATDIDIATLSLIPSEGSIAEYYSYDFETLTLHVAPEPVILQIGQRLLTAVLLPSYRMSDAPARVLETGEMAFVRRFVGYAWLPGSPDEEGFRTISYEDDNFFD